MKGLKERLKRKRLVYLSLGVGDPGSEITRHWAIEIDSRYPYSGGFTDKREDASAFTLKLATAINKSMRELGYQEYTIEEAPKDHDGSIFCLKRESEKR